MSEAELAGDLVETALVAHIADGFMTDQPAPDGHTHETSCLNCAAPLTGPFCSECGQAAHLHRTLAAFFHDLLHGVFHFEGRIWHTLPLLIMHPGTLTRRYINGHRARFISPLALFLFCVFLLFAAIQQTAQDIPIETHATGNAATQARRLHDVEAQITRLQADRRGEISRKDDTDDTDAGIATLQTIATALKHGETAPTVQPADAITAAPTGLAMIDRVVRSIKENPGLARYKVEMHAYKYSWLLIPISVPFVWLLFPFDRRFPVYDHTVFVTYSLSFMTLLSIIVLIGQSLGLAAITWLLVVVPPIHMYRQLRGAYQCSRLGAVLRTAALVIAAAIALVIFTGMIVAESTD